MTNSTYHHLCWTTWDKTRDRGNRGGYITIRFLHHWQQTRSALQCARVLKSVALSALWPSNAPCQRVNDMSHPRCKSGYNHAPHPYHALHPCSCPVTPPATPRPPLVTPSPPLSHPAPSWSHPLVTPPWLHPCHPWPFHLNERWLREPTGAVDGPCVLM